MVAARSEDDVIRKILGLPKRHHLGTIPMYQWIHLVLADQLAYNGRRLILVRPRNQIPMIPNFFTNLSVRLHPFRRALIAGLLFVISAIFAFVFLLVVPGRVALPTLMLFAVPLLVILWASICCASWFHPEHGRLSINRFSGRKQPAAVQSFARWYAATFLVIFVLAGVLGPLVLFR